MPDRISQPQNNPPSQPAPATEETSLVLLEAFKDGCLGAATCVSVANTLASAGIAMKYLSKQEYIPFIQAMTTAGICGICTKAFKALLRDAPNNPR